MMGCGWKYGSRIINTRKEELSLRQASKGEANWVQQERSKAPDVTCIALLLEWPATGSEPGGTEAVEPAAKKARTETEKLEN